jgi:transformer-2 protein
MHPLFVFQLKKFPFTEMAFQAPNPSNVLGVFGLSIRTTERDLDEEFTRFGHVEKVTIVYDQRVCLPCAQ